MTAVAVALAHAQGACAGSPDFRSSGVRLGLPCAVLGLGGWENEDRDLGEVHSANYGELWTCARWLGEGRPHLQGRGCRLLGGTMSKRIWSLTRM